MAGLWQRTGNVTVTNGSKTLTGFGTKWKTGTLPIQKGHTFYGPDNAAYEVDTVVSDTEILLVDTYRGGTLANQPYRIDITRTSTISQFAADLASLVAKYRSWFDGMMAWLTGTGDVPILNPDTGATVTIPSWAKVASEGEGQAARAKTEADSAKIEADRSKAEADRATSIVANAARDAALPFPDVWVPFNDSLRIFAGSGREVKVGEDVVGRYVDFARASTATYFDKAGVMRTAAINEPRFEAGGLLIEGQSSNLLAKSNDFTAGVGWSYTASTPTPAATASPTRAQDATKLKASSGVGAHYMQPQTSPTYTAGQRYTVSLFAKKAELKFLQLIITAQASGGANYVATFNLETMEVIKSATVDSTAVISTCGNGWYRCCFSFLSYATSANLLQIRLANALSTTPSTFDGNDIDGLYIYGIQLEAMPYATSYIPTTSASATRVAESVKVPAACNINPTNTDVTYSMQIEYKGGPSQIIPFRTDGVISPSGAVISSSGKAWFFTDAATSVPASNNAAILGMNLFVAHNNQAGAAVYLNGDFGGTRTPSRGAPLTDSTTLHIGSNHVQAESLFGHIRNLRIWHQALTDAQIKAIK